MFICGNGADPSMSGYSKRYLAIYNSVDSNGVRWNVDQTSDPRFLDSEHDVLPHNQDLIVVFKLGLWELSRCSKRRLWGIFRRLLRALPFSPSRSGSREIRVRRGRASTFLHRAGSRRTHPAVQAARRFVVSGARVWLRHDSSMQDSATILRPH